MLLATSFGLWCAACAAIHVAVRRLYVRLVLMVTTWLFFGAVAGWLLLQGEAGPGFLAVGFFAAYASITTWTLLLGLPHHERK